MTHPLDINLVLIGIGGVGSTLVQQIIDSQAQLRSQNLQFRIRVVLNSEHIWFPEKPLSRQWEQHFHADSKPGRLLDAISFCQAKGLQNLIAIDATASSEITDLYKVLIHSGFHLVAANKKANSAHWSDYQGLRTELTRHGKNFRYETNVGSGLPIIDLIRNLNASGEKIQQIRGVFSGSCSYLFNTFSASEASFSSILEEARVKGYTEPDPREDLSGQDVARKLLILARELGLAKNLEDVTIESLIPPSLGFEVPYPVFQENQDLLDAKFAAVKLALPPHHVLRYVGTLNVKEATLAVELLQVPLHSPLGQLKGADALFEVFSSSYREFPIVLQGAGAGKQVTARGVLSDIVRIAESITIPIHQFV